MEFSWAYEDTMRRIASESCYVQTSTSCGAVDSNAYVAMLQFDLNKRCCDVPSILAGRIASYFPTDPEEVVTIVFPLFTGCYQKSCAGAETMLKYFTRESSGRINKVITSKGEIYYGNNGLILDKDFSPLLLSTVHMELNPETNRLETKYYTIHLHPNVFTDDTKLLNKSLAKKGIAYYLSNDAYNGWGSAHIPYKVEIDDCSQYIIKAKRPDVNTYTDSSLNQILKENIDEVLRQIADDNRRHI